MILKKLILNNYKTYYGHQELNLDIPPQVRSDKNKNIILIGGLNGAGKTTILKAVHYALFGKRGISEMEYKRIFSNVINNHFFDEGGRECYISLIVENDNLEEWELKVKWIFDHNKKVVHENREIAIRKPGSSVGKRSAVNNIDTFNRFIDRKIPYHVAPFFIFDGEEIKEIILRQNSEELKIAIQKLSGLETYKTLLDDLKETKFYLDKKLMNSIGSSKTTNYTQELNRVSIELVELNQKLKAVNQRKIGLEEEIKELKKIRAEKIQLNSKSRESILKKLTACEVNLSQAQKEFNDKFNEQAYIHLLTQPIQELKGRITLEEKERERLHSINSSYSPYKEFLIKLFDGDISPQLTESQRIQLLKNGEEIWNSKADELNREKITIIHDLNKHQFNILKNITIKPLSDLKGIHQRISQLQFDINQFEEEIRNAPESVDIEDENTKIDNLTKMLGEVELRARSFKNKTTALREDKTKYENLLTRSTSNDSNTEDLRAQIEQVNSTIIFLNQYVAEVTKLKAVFIHNEFKLMLSELIRKQDEFGRIEFDVNTYTIRLFNDRNQEISVHDRSAGEMQIISSALIWALTKSSKFSLPMLIDTPLGRLDSYHRNHLINKYYKELSDQVIILSTDTEITKDYIDSITQNSFRQYVLEYNDKLKYTLIRDGYFDLKR
ncbi:DNA sulfur modification protein DndD [Paenibacillus hexagrammi]|uniref:Nuclease SbcCD subunit C n=1 Tax=Paenibacillus hexagrammi TaxID=2908839 RepID=A0ABY3SGR0_9BACL|nr:DNA sulfur modification protein DndD [Paenibacillus sp. YPD9-1]UJF32660.1 DNA sulfur modification protein DndD [Paenibacillus sp. YPD9-1]